WRGFGGQGSVVATQDGNHGPVSMTLTPNNCAGCMDTIVFRKAKFLGIMSDMYYLDIENFGRMLRGKVITFDWISDANIQNPYPMPCPLPCVPVGSTRRATDIALTGPAGWDTLPVASSIGDGNFRVTNHPVGGFAVRASTPRAVKLSGDFNGDGWGDIALTGPAGWHSLPVAFSKRDGTFTETNEYVGEFAGFASDPQAVKLSGDFNGDGKTDIALTGPSYWNTLPVAFSNGDGTFKGTNSPVGGFARWASNTQAVKLTGDFNGDGKTDIALTGAAGWNMLPVALSKGDGTFNVTNFSSVTGISIGTFARWASNPQAAKLIGDFNGDGKADIALVGGTGSNTLPVAFSNGNGTFIVRNSDVTPSIQGDYFNLASDPQAAKLTGDFNGDGKTDIALVGGAGWDKLLVAFSDYPGSFHLTSFRAVDFASWASDSQAVKMTGDFNGDGRTDIALTGSGYWNTLPVAFSKGNGEFTVTNKDVGAFARWVSYPHATILTRDFN
ncbi:MAG: VCBS repeat-containing protein, partial [Acidobacteria bacterium]|nr:VCBS repeat-containing protein [Acidobacteriota bacterium]